MKIVWKTAPFDELTVAELYAILKLRQLVFIVEQRCLYQDCDDRDRAALHLTAWLDQGGKRKLAGYLRILPAGVDESHPALGRVVTHPDYRGEGLGKELVTRCLMVVSELFPDTAVSISAQQYLIGFYESFGFRVCSEGYEEDGIPHIRMIRHPQKEDAG